MQVAEQQGKYLARTFNKLAKDPQAKAEPFSYKHMGSMASIGESPVKLLMKLPMKLPVKLPAVFSLHHCICAFEAACARAKHAQRTRDHLHHRIDPGHGLMQ